ncbi:MAG: cytochrome bc complex cytochrome b subunit [Solirubrobacteraceae bacterium]
MSVLRRRSKPAVSDEEAVTDAVRFVDERLGVAPFIKATMSYLFPDNWTFLFGEIALYSFIVLLVTGTYLAFFFDPSTATTQYTGAYAPLHGATVSEAYNSTLGIVFDVPAGLTIRQTHHWAALVFVVAMIIHLMRVFFTGAFRKPRDLVYYLGLVMLMLTLLEGFLGYSLVDDLLSGMGLAIAYSVVLSLPVVGGNAALLMWGAPFPGPPEFEARMYVAHVFILPVAIAILLSLHLLLIVARHHTQFRHGDRSERRVVGLPAFPAYAPRSIGLAFAVAAVLVLLGGLVQINPVWQWGPYETAAATNGAQPDWYLGWLIGALRLVPGFDVTIGDYTLIPNPFWGGALLPFVVFALLFAWPAIERRRTGDREHHNLLDRPRNAPWRTAVGAAALTFLAVVFVAGSADRVEVSLGIPYAWQLWILRAALLVAPPLVYVATRRICVELTQRERSEVSRFSAPRAG